MYVLFLDDERHPDKVTWAEFPREELTVIVRNYEAFVKQVTVSGLPAFVCFDHDLADQHYEAMLREANGDPDSLINGIADYGPVKTGYDCARWLVDYCVDKKKKFPKYVVHSMNPAGRERIKGYIENAKKTSRYLNSWRVGRPVMQQIANLYNP